MAKVSPVTASASYLAHVRAAWNHRIPQAPLEEQEVVLTVPASFDEAARALTLEAAREAGLPTLRLLEEPQAAFYDWLFRHRHTLADELADTRLVLVCDVGGGTTDLSLVRVEMRDGEPRLERVAVGRHLMLGGDNMDLALAHLCREQAAPPPAGAQRLAAGALSQLVERCRAAKERLLARRRARTARGDAAGRRLAAGRRRAARSTWRRDEVERIVVDGFFPQERPTNCRAANARPAASWRSACPYASDPAVTRHVATFLQQHRGSGWPDALLLNGGVFRAHAIAARLARDAGGWRGAPLKPLHNADPDVAVARGAVAYALARRGLAPKYRRGAARSYFLVRRRHEAATPRAASACCRAAATKGTRCGSKAAALR